MSGPRTPQQRYVRSDEVLWRRASGAVVLLLLDGGEPFELTGTGPALWDLLARPTTIEEAASVLGAAFGAAPEEVAADIEPILGELVRRTVLTATDPG